MTKNWTNCMGEDTSTNNTISAKTGLSVDPDQVLTLKHGCYVVIQTLTLYYVYYTLLFYSKLGFYLPRISSSPNSKIKEFHSKTQSSWYSMSWFILKHGSVKKKSNSEAFLIVHTSKEVVHYYFSFSLHLLPGMW